MAHLYDLFKPKDLLDNLGKGYVRTQTSPDGSRVIFNYTNQTQYEGAWNEVTKQTRGLIIDSKTEKIVSRPFQKFFNYEQLNHADQADLMHHEVETFKKWDGSLGVGYTLNTGEFRIATRGSFTSPQAEHANRILTERYPTFEPILGLTYLFEIVYPANRVVVDYKDLDDLVLLAVINTATGLTLAHGDYDWPGPVNQPVHYKSLGEVLAKVENWPDKNAEGFVVRFPHNDLRVKFKYDEYKRLHRILTNVSTLSVWEALAAGQGIGEFIDHVPDEFYSWVHQQVHRLEADFDREHAAVLDDYEYIVRRLRRPETDGKKRRKEFALQAQTTPYPGLLFRLYDGHDITADVWKRVRPEFEKPFWTPSEDAA
ncbi:RNA ligase [Streptomyces sp. BK022]|uniref:RNA ligase n=1 Tax=Streptomyces sp. BK022 TaxID=2512123 RepID=UPI001028DEEE|nr:RNA ligase [Streptomyces sp. BK022]RZU36034.1 RNA ligase [Streptomyces sp. BK022]